MHFKIYYIFINNYIKLCVHNPSTTLVSVKWTVYYTSVALWGLCVHLHQLKQDTAFHFDHEMHLFCTETNVQIV